MLKGSNVSMFLSIFLAILAIPQKGAAIAQPGKTGKYAVVNMQQIILQVEEGKKARKALEVEIKSKEKGLLAKKKELDKMNKDWKSQAPLLSESAKFKKQQEFQEKFMALRNEEMAFQQDIKRKEAKATQKIAVKVTKIVGAYAKKRGFEMVFETSSAGLVYLKNPVDITSDIVAAYASGAPAGKKNTAKK